MQKTYTPTHLPTKYQDDKEVNIERSCFMHRSTWLFMLVDEMKKAGVDYETIARNAVARCGDLDAHTRYDATTMQELKDKLLDDITLKTMEGNATVTDDTLDIEFTYCPHLQAWQKLTDDPKMIDLLCDIAMEGDREIFRQHPEWNYELTDRMGAGCKTCKMHITKKK